MRKHLINLFSEIKTFTLPSKGTLANIKPEIGYCHYARVPASLISDTKLSEDSHLMLFEDGGLLGPAHSYHKNIRDLGCGCYSHWDGYVYFSASDNSDPRTNGRTYTFSYHTKMRFKELAVVNKLVKKMYKPIVSKSKINRWVERTNANFTPLTLHRNKKPKIVQYIGQLGPGGAERQLCNLSLKLHEMGFDITTLTGNPLEGTASHYKHLLDRKNIPVRMADRHCDINMLRQKLPANPILRDDSIKYTFYGLDKYIRTLAHELLTIKPDILHCWLDDTNIAGGIAGLIAGVGNIVLSTRSANPTHFPYLNKPQRKWQYKLLAGSKRVQFLNNSEYGASDYARWLDIPRSRFTVIYNGMDLDGLEKVSPKDVISLKKSLNIDSSTHIIGGVFRLSAEKRLDHFLAVIRQVEKQCGNIKVVIAGVGVLENKFRQMIKEKHLDNAVILLGQRNDTYTIIKACDVILLTSEMEGTPNVLLEAQYLGVPVVATKAGGIPEIVDDGISGLLHPTGDIHGMSKSIVRILNDKEYGKVLGAKGHEFVKKRFSIHRMINDILCVYHDAPRKSGMVK